MKKGFTLIELLVLIIMIALVAAIIIPATIKVNAERVKNDMGSPKTQILDQILDATVRGNIVEITYDGCQYVFFGNGFSSWGSHKGNCNNPIHQYRTEKEKNE